MLKKLSAKNDQKYSKSLVPMERIERLIFVIRDQKVILDQDLAALYGVETKALNQAIRRNADRFPEDFAFQLTEEEWTFLRSRIATSNSESEILRCQSGISNAEQQILKSQIVTSRSGWGGKRKLPIVFTEHGVVMAANVLRSHRAVSVSIEIVRAFVKMRQIMATQKEITKELVDLKSFLLKRFHETDREFKRIWNARPYRTRLISHAGGTFGRAIEKLGRSPTKKECRQMGFDLS